MNVIYYYLAKIANITLVLVCATFMSGQHPVSMAEGIVSNFTSPNGCQCPGEQTIYKCSSEGGVATVWQGSAFDCEAEAIILRHRRFTDLLGARGECNNGRIRASSIGVVNSTYTSQLNITVSEKLDNKTIKCENENIDGRIVTVGIAMVIVTTGIYNIILNNNDRLMSTYFWSHDIQPIRCVEKCFKSRKAHLSVH